MGIKEDFELYKHPYWGVVGLNPAGNEKQTDYTCDNYHMLNALYWLVLYQNGTTANVDEIVQTTTFDIACEKLPGLYARFPSRMNDDISQDEIYGICQVDSMGAINIESYGSANWWSYWLANPNHWHWDYCLGRQPSFVAYIKASAGKPIPFSQFIWAIGFLASAFTGYTETSGKLLSYIQSHNMNSYFFPRQVVKLWKWIMMKRYPGGLNDIMKIYFAPQPNHPFITYSKGNFE